MKHNNKEIEKYRTVHPLYGLNMGEGNNGFFVIPFECFELCVISSDEIGYDHVSVSLKHRTPNWKEMCFIKDLFFEGEETVLQIHPPKSKYVNISKTCLHLWRKQPTETEGENGGFAIPPRIMV